MNDFIFHQEKNVVSNNLEAFFCISGEQDFFDDSGYPRCSDANNSLVCAKKLSKNNNTIKYLIRINRDGKMYNPISLYGKKDESYTKNSPYSKARTFKEVNHKSFNMYINFLKTKNIAWLQNAEREAE
jgi:hypothetical protein